MADTKISALPAATALDGSEALPVVQGGVSKQTPMLPFIWKVLEVDFGSTVPLWEKDFYINDPALPAGATILVLPNGNTATGRVGDDGDWDALICSAVSEGAGFMEVCVMAYPGPILGKRKIMYAIVG